MNAYIYQAALVCEDCALAIRAELTTAGKAPVDPDDEGSYDSDDFPKGPFADGGGEADSPQHCDCGGGCVNAIETDAGLGYEVGCWLENELTEEGRKVVQEALEHHRLAGRGELALQWAEWYGISLNDDEADCNDDEADCEEEDDEQDTAGDPS